MQAPLEDGSYDAFIVSADPEEHGAVSLEVTITIGQHKGDVLNIRATRLGRDPIDLIGMPCRLVIDGGVPRVNW